MLCSRFHVTSGQTTHLINTNQTNKSVVTVCIMTFDRILHCDDVSVSGSGINHIAALSLSSAHTEKLK